MFTKKKVFKVTTMVALALTAVGAGAATTASQAHTVQAAFAKFADVASYQNSDEYYFKSLASGNIAGVVVKLTQGSANGDNYINPKAGAQIASARAAGMKVSLYHYAKYNGTQDAINEANFFANAAEQYGLGKDTVMVADVEDPSLSNPYADTVTFQNQLKARGYNNQVVYSMASWFWANKLPRNYPIWVANYNGYAPGVDNAAAWQYTSNYNGMSLDMSYDFTGLFTNNSVTQAPTTVQAAASTQSSIKNVITVGANGANGVHSNGSFARAFSAGSQWKSDGYRVINGQLAFLVGSDTYIYLKDTTQAKVATVRSSNTNAVDSNGNSLNSNGKFSAGSQWLINGVTTINGRAAYKVSNSEYLWVSDTNGSGN